MFASNIEKGWLMKACASHASVQMNRSPSGPMGSAVAAGLTQSGQVSSSVSAA
jgi:hypothetical protein